MMMFPAGKPQILVMSSIVIYSYVFIIQFLKIFLKCFNSDPYWDPDLNFPCNWMFKPFVVCLQDHKFGLKLFQTDWSSERTRRQEVLKKLVETQLVVSLDRKVYGKVYWTVYWSCLYTQVVCDILLLCFSIFSNSNHYWGPPHGACQMLWWLHRFPGGRNSEYISVPEKELGGLALFCWNNVCLHTFGNGIAVNPSMKPVLFDVFCFSICFVQFPAGRLCVMAFQYVSVLV